MVGSSIFSNSSTFDCTISLLFRRVISSPCHEWLRRIASHDLLSLSSRCFHFKLKFWIISYRFEPGVTICEHPFTGSFLGCITCSNCSKWNRKFAMTNNFYVFVNSVELHWKLYNVVRLSNVPNVWSLKQSFEDTSVIWQILQKRLINLSFYATHLSLICICSSCKFLANLKM